MEFVNAPLSKRRYAQGAGVLYVLIAVIGGFSIGYMPSEIVVDGNATITFQNLSQKFNLFRMGIGGDILVLLMETCLTVMLFQLFKDRSATSIRIATFSRLAMAIIMGINLLFYLVPAVLVSEPESFTGLQAVQKEALALLFLKAHHYGVMAWQVFFALHLLTLGYVLCNSNTTSKVLSSCLVIGSIGYAGDCISQLLLVQSSVLQAIFALLLVLAVIGEIWFAIWLIAKGGKLSSKSGTKTTPSFDVLFF